ncbi:mevalonate kinase [PVC group bacterium]|nr:mevalonate kinase [PVC group bacterium]
MVIKASGVGYAKLLLFGEHAAVCGYPALGLTLPLSTEVVLSTSTNGKHLSTWQLPVLPQTEKQKLRELETYFRRIFPRLSQIPFIHVRIKTNIPKGAGLGSSAALCTALSKAVLGLLKKHGEDRAKKILTNQRAFWELANNAEKIFHGTPSGVDTGLAFMNGLFRFSGRKNSLPNIKKVMCPSFTLVVGALRRTENTKFLVSRIRKRVQKKHMLTKQTLKSLGAKTDQFIFAARQRKTHVIFLDTFGALAEAAQTELGQLSLSTKNLEGVLVKAASIGSLGEKLSGAGGGGAYYCVCLNQQTAKKIKHKINTHLKKKRIASLLCPTIIKYHRQKIRII